MTKEQANRGELWPFQLARVEHRPAPLWQVLSPSGPLPGLYREYEVAYSAAQAAGERLKLKRTHRLQPVPMSNERR